MGFNSDVYGVGVLLLELISPKEIGQFDYLLPSTLATEVSGLVNHSTFLSLRSAFQSRLV